MGLYMVHEVSRMMPHLALCNSTNRTQTKQKRPGSDPRLVPIRFYFVSFFVSPSAFQRLSKYLLYILNPSPPENL